MIPITRSAFVALVTLLVGGCQTASLEDAAPRNPDVAGLETTAVAPVTAEPAVPAAETATVIRRNPGFMSPVPIEKTVPAEPREFVEEGARRTGQYPKFGNEPRAAYAQLSDAERLAAEAEMTELLRNRASTPDARAEYEARLRQLRALAASHANDTQREIEN